MDFSFVVQLFQLGIFKNNVGLLLQFLNIINAQNAQNRSTPVTTPSLPALDIISLNGISGLKTILQKDNNFNLGQIPVNKTEEFTLGSLFKSKFQVSGTDLFSSAANIKESISALASEVFSISGTSGILQKLSSSKIDANTNQGSASPNSTSTAPATSTWGNYVDGSPLKVTDVLRVNPGKINSAADKSYSFKVTMPYTSSPSSTLANINVGTVKADSSPTALVSTDFISLIDKSFQFYEAQQSGDLSTNTNRVVYDATYQPLGWTNDNFTDDGVSYNGTNLGVVFADNDQILGNAPNSVGPWSTSLAGGLFDAGDHVKYNLPGATAMSTLAIGAWNDLSEYNRSNLSKSATTPYSTTTGAYTPELGESLFITLKQQADYYLKCAANVTVDLTNTSAPVRGYYIAQTGETTYDHDSWKSSWVESSDGSTPRYSYAVGIDAPLYSKSGTSFGQPGYVAANGIDVLAANAAALANIAKLFYKYPQFAPVKDGTNDTSSTANFQAYALKLLSTAKNLDQMAWEVNALYPASTTADGKGNNQTGQYQLNISDQVGGAATTLYNYPDVLTGENKGGNTVYVSRFVYDDLFMSSVALFNAEKTISGTGNDGLNDYTKVDYLNNAMSTLYGYQNNSSLGISQYDGITDPNSHGYWNNTGTSFEYTNDGSNLKYPYQPVAFTWDNNALLCNILGIQTMADWSRTNNYNSTDTYFNSYATMKNQVLKCVYDWVYGSPINDTNLYPNGAPSDYVQITPSTGLRWSGGNSNISQWGSLRLANNASFIAGWAIDEGVIGSSTTFQYDYVNGNSITKTITKADTEAFIKATLNYSLGITSPNNQSFVVGYGDFPQEPHHRDASGITDLLGYGNSIAPYDGTDNKYDIIGALVGGPTDYATESYSDMRTNYVGNEVTLDYNAAFTNNLMRAASIF
ncbi:glycoside hydrolase family 9 protein [Synechococcus lacustris]|uniref:Endoglucanase n=1 Tax=Synechococcus lacustris str. Tous TaxID=1910958 RepID=A0A2P7ED73_9SYNE|nr:glycoside hydrolase family 9 protein [Synechococcus lacustris]PSI01162.1 hypothetical protein C7K08_09320 [Synechococcus lacustris str. Tous]